MIDICELENLCLEYISKLNETLPTSCSAAELGKERKERLIDLYLASCNLFLALPKTYSFLSLKNMRKVKSNERVEEDLKERFDKKHLNATLNRQRIEEEKLKKVKEQNKRADVIGKQYKENEKVIKNEKLQRKMLKAQTLKVKCINSVKEKAKDENLKVKEVLYINNTMSEHNRMDFERKMNNCEKRRERHLSNIKRKAGMTSRKTTPKNDDNSSETEADKENKSISAIESLEVERNTQRKRTSVEKDCCYNLEKLISSLGITGYADLYTETRSRRKIKMFLSKSLVSEGTKADVKCVPLHIRSKVTAAFNSIHIQESLRSLSASFNKLTKNLAKTNLDGYFSSCEEHTLDSLFFQIKASIVLNCIRSSKSVLSNKFLQITELVFMCSLKSPFFSEIVLKEGYFFVLFEVATTIVENYKNVANENSKPLLLNAFCHIIDIFSILLAYIVMQKKDKVLERFLTFVCADGILTKLFSVNKILKDGHSFLGASLRGEKYDTGNLEASESIDESDYSSTVVPISISGTVSLLRRVSNLMLKLLSGYNEFNHSNGTLIRELVANDFFNLVSVNASLLFSLEIHRKRYDLSAPEEFNLNLMDQLLFLLKSLNLTLQMKRKPALKLLMSSSLKAEFQHMFKDLFKLYAKYFPKVLPPTKLFTKVESIYTSSKELKDVLFIKAEQLLAELLINIGYICRSSMDQGFVTFLGTSLCLVQKGVYSCAIGDSPRSKLGKHILFPTLMVVVVSDPTLFDKLFADESLIQAFITYFDSEFYEQDPRLSPHITTSFQQIIKYSKNS
eukprot:augustus_masked-scaffold_6-processed-gene-14.53-mRNA-1 protein AED:1.00 eAED:1.00 QI:0/-1/0/0/-1/1/1/0/792